MSELIPAPTFGDTIENGWASEENPTRVGYFVEQGRRTGKMNAGPYIRVTDGRGKFWELPITRDHKIKVTPAAWNTRPTEDRLVGALEEAERALEALIATVRGECPSLLNEDSGGNASLSEQVDAALTRIRAAKGGE